MPEGSITWSVCLSLSLSLPQDSSPPVFHSCLDFSPGCCCCWGWKPDQMALSLPLSLFRRYLFLSCPGWWMSWMAHQTHTLRVEQNNLHSWSLISRLSTSVSLSDDETSGCCYERDSRVRERGLVFFPLPPLFSHLVCLLQFFSFIPFIVL